MCNTAHRTELFWVRDEWAHRENQLLPCLSSYSCRCGFCLGLCYTVMLPFWPGKNSFEAQEIILVR